MANLVTPMPMIRARFFDDNGRPLSGGKIYTYEPNTTTPKTTYKDLAATTPNTNPILLDVAGEANIYFDGLYRVIVESWRGEKLYDVDNIGALAQIKASFIVDASGKNQQQINDELVATSQFTAQNIADLANIPTQKSVYIRSHHNNNNLGGGLFYWDSAKSKTAHDGGVVIDPLMLTAIPTDWTNTTQVSAWLVSENAGTGCWVRDSNNTPTIFDYGFTPNSLAHNATNTLLFQKLVDNNIVSRVPYYDAPLYVTNGINIKNGRRVVGDSDYMNEPLLADPDRGIIGDGSGAVFTTGTYPATANTNRQLHFKSLRVRNTNQPCFDLLHSDDAVMDDCIAYTTGGDSGSSILFCPCSLSWGALRIFIRHLRR